MSVSLPADVAADPLGNGVGASNTLSVVFSNDVVADSLDVVTLPQSVRRGENASVSVSYRAAGLRDVQILLHDSQEGWRVDASHFAQVAGGAGTLALDLPVAPGARLGDGYLWAVRLIPAGSDYTEAADEFYQSASVLASSGGVLIDSIDRFSAPETVERGQTVVVEMEYQAADTRDVELLLQDSQTNWQTVGSAPAQVTAGSGTLTFNVTIAGDARVGDGYVWVNRLLPAGGDNSEALGESYLSASVQPSSTGGGGVDLINDFSAPAMVFRSDAASVRIDYEATEDRDINVVLLDSQDGWRVVGEARSGVAAGIGSKEFTIGIASDGRIGDGYVWVGQLLPVGALDNSTAFDEKYVGASLSEPPESGSLVNHAVLPDAISSQSSVFGTAFISDLARDGNTDGDWRNGSVTHTELDQNAWWEIDLGSSKAIDHIFVWNRTDCCAERLVDFYVLVSDEPFQTQDLEASIAQPGVFSAFYEGTPEPTAQVDVGGRGRYVRVQLAGQGYLSLAEVEVFGSLGGEVVHGLTYQVYEGAWTALPVFDELQARKTGTVTNVSLAPRTRDDFFAIRFRGCLIVPADGSYTFYTNSDAGSRLILDGEIVVDNDGDHALRERSGVVELTEGMHPMEIHYFETEGESALEVSWEGPGIAKEAIPDGALSVNETRVSPTFRYALPQLSASSNADGDLLDLAAEFALGQNPNDGRFGSAGLQLDVQEDAVHVYYDRPPGLTEFQYLLEASDDLENWVGILGAEILHNEDGSERVFYRRVHERVPLRPERGFVRLRIEHGPWDHVSYLPACGWQATSLTAGHQTFGSAFLNSPVFGSSIASVSGSRIIANVAGLTEVIAAETPYYLEFASGPYEGHRLEIDTDLTTDQSIAIDFASPLGTLSLEGLQAAEAQDSRFVIYEHHTLGNLFEKTLFEASNDPGEADQVLFFEGDRYAAHFLLSGGGRYHWAKVNDSELESRDDRVVPPGEGSFIKRGDDLAPLTLRRFGHVRPNDFVQPLRVGFNLVAAPHPLTVSPRERGLTTANGFLGHLDPQAADQVQRWVVGELRFEGLFLLDAGNGPYWTPIDSTDLENSDMIPWFPADRAVFLRLAEDAHADYRVPSPLR